METHAIRAVWNLDVLAPLAHENPEFLRMIAAAYARFGCASEAQASVAAQWVNTLLPLTSPAAPLKEEEELQGEDAVRLAWCVVRVLQKDNASKAPRTLAELRRCVPSVDPSDIYCACAVLIQKETRFLSAYRLSLKTLVVDEVRRVYETYLPKLAPELVSSGPVELIDMEAARAIFLCKSFGDGVLTKELGIQGQAAFAARKPLGFSETRAQAMRSVLLRRAIACGFDPRAAAPGYLNPRPNTAPPSLSQRIRKNVQAAFGEDAFDWRDASVAPSASYRQCAFAETQETQDETEALQVFGEKTAERAWRRALLRSTGSLGDLGNSPQEYHFFRQTWARLHENDDQKPPPELRAELGCECFLELLVARRAHLGKSLSREFLDAYVVDALSAEDADFVQRVVLECPQEKEAWQKVCLKLEEKRSS